MIILTHFISFNFISAPSAGHHDLGEAEETGGCFGQFVFIYFCVLNSFISLLKTMEHTLSVLVLAIGGFFPVH